jgi:type 1 glutamine amidotransferase/lysophospholipase L1-like esterase
MIEWMTVCAAALTSTRRASRAVSRRAALTIVLPLGALASSAACNGQQQRANVDVPGAGGATASADTVAPGTPIRVLVVTATQGFRHGDAIAASKERLKEAEASSELRFDFTEDPTALNARNLARYDVLFVNNATLRITPANANDSASLAAVHWPRTGIVNPITREQQDAIASFVRGGKGLVAVHAGVDAFDRSPEYREMVGGGLFHSHPFTRVARVTIEDSTNAAVVPLLPSFSLKEEYYYLDRNPRSTSHVLLSLDLASVGDTTRTDHPLAFIRRYGQGRVYVNVLGHFAETWRRQDYFTGLLQGIRIAAGRLPADFSGSQSPPPSLPAPRNSALPTIFHIGDSTVRNGSGNGANGEWGWGDLISCYFDTARVNVVNRALGGRSSRTYLTQGHWERTLPMLKRGDVVIMQFGHNDGGALNDTSRARGSIRGVGNETEEIDNLLTHEHEVVHSYGWYMRKFIADTRVRGATPVVASLVPRNIWENGAVVRNKKDYAGWAEDVARAEGVAFVDLNERIAREYDALGPEKVKALFGRDHTHTTREGAKLNARVVLAAVQALPSNPVGSYLTAGAAATGNGCD